ncbi:MAG: hypothetical protein AAGK47_04640 [Bacteroidota bacterium]
MNLSKLCTTPIVTSALNLVLLLICQSGFAQIRLDNPSFEGEPQDATVPVGWFPCATGTTPDILPGYWGVYNEASEGDTYIGLITRRNGSHESIGQRLAQPLPPKECYAFAIDLAHSDAYAGYNRPLHLKIWGGGVKCAKDQLLWSTNAPIEAEDWATFNINFITKSTINYLIIEAVQPNGTTAYEGNILVDNIRPIKKCPRAMNDLDRLRK